MALPSIFGLNFMGAASPVAQTLNRSVREAEGEGKRGLTWGESGVPVARTRVPESGEEDTTGWLLQHIVLQMRHMGTFRNFCPVEEGGVARVGSWF